MNKKAWNIISACVIVAGVVGFIATGGTEGGAVSIVSLTVAVIAAAVALWKSIKG